MVLLGAPGSGKGTQAAILAGRLGVPAISTGDMLRQAVAAGSALGRSVEGTMMRGKLVDDATMAEIVRRRLEEDDARRGFLLDGYPRTVPQAGTLEEILAGQQARLDAVVLIEVPEPVLVERALARKRSDDTEEAIRERLVEYGKKTEPLVRYYQVRSLLREVDGEGSVSEVTAAVSAALEV